MKKQILTLIISSMPIFSYSMQHEQSVQNGGVEGCVKHLEKCGYDIIDIHPKKDDLPSYKDIPAEDHMKWVEDYNYACKYTVITYDDHRDPPESSTIREKD